jgi:hypothetical protein
MRSVQGSEPVQDAGDLFIDPQARLPSWGRNTRPATVARPALKQEGR